MENMQGLAALLQAGSEVDPEQLQKELMRHQAPVVYQVRSLIETLNSFSNSLNNSGNFLTHKLNIGLPFISNV